MTTKHIWHSKREAPECQARFVWIVFTHTMNNIIESKPFDHTDCEHWEITRVNNDIREWCYQDELFDATQLYDSRYTPETDSSRETE